MLLEQIIRVGQPIASSAMSIEEKVQLLTDVGSDQVKNFYKHIFLIRFRDENSLQFFSLQDDSGNVDIKKAAALPITLPSGGNPLLAQGIYPIPCYPLYEVHINQFSDPKKTEQMVLDRLQKTIPYFYFSPEQLKEKSARVAEILHTFGMQYVTDEKQLGILLIADDELDLFHPPENATTFIIRQNGSESIVINANQIVSNIVEGRFQEAKELGEEKNAISTISNELSDEVVSAYNKGWLFLSPTWEMPKSIYWGKNEWTKGIRLNRKEYEAFFYGTQYLKKVQTPLQASLLKEMFAPISSAEAKQHMKPTSFESIYAIPFILPILHENNDQMYKRFQILSRKLSDEHISKTDLQLEIIGGLEKRIIPQSDDDYRLTILYYSGELGRGNIHIRAMIEDVVPSVAYQVQRIVQDLVRQELSKISRLFNDHNTNYIQFKIKHLPSLLANAYGPGYLWSSLHDVLHRQPIYLDRVTKQTANRLNELANKEEYWQLIQELLFYHSFRYFYQQYVERILNKKEGTVTMAEWKEILDRYIQGELTEEDVDTSEKIGFLTGCLLQQFSRSYAAKTGRKFLETRVMRFGSKLTPEMIWKNGLLKMEELRQQWDLGIQRKNYDPALALVLMALVDLDKNQLLKKEKDVFMTMFWSGYLMYSHVKKGEAQHASE